ncbi:MAG TPA: HlyD family efflux transporter periplasmic adaptor subunit [Coriobacteriia bacterium]
MKRPWFVPLALVVLLAALAWLASSRLAANDAVRSGALAVAANVRADPVTLLAPSLAATRSAGASAQPAVAGRLASVEVSAGARVAAGQVVARLDDAALALRVEQAKAAARGARARIGVVDANLDTLADNSATLADARRTLDKTLAQLQTSRAEIVRNLEQARALVRSLPPGVKPPGMTVDPRALVAKLEAGLAKIDAGMAKIAAGRAKLDSGAAKLSDARSQLRGARGVVELAADAADAGVPLAEARRELAVIRASSGGLVTWAAEPGTVVFAGGPVVRILPDGPRLLDTYLDADQTELVRVGASASAAVDSLPGSVFPGQVTGIRPVYEYPPTGLPTTLIHMTRAFKVTVTLDDSTTPLPYGTPADLTISTRSE